MSAHAILTAETHRDLRVRIDRSSALGDAMMCCLVVPAEFRRVQDSYPILFRHNLERDSFSALAMFGFDADENLFLEDGRWDARYLPLAVDIQPFLIGGGRSGSGDKQVHVDLDSPRIADAGGESVRVFDTDGRPTPYLEAVAEKLGELDAGYAEYPSLFAALRRYDLLEPLTLEITLDDGSTNRLVGFHVIDEARLQGLDAIAVSDLHAAGHLMPIFMAVASLGRLNDLVARKNRRLAGG